MKTFHFKIIFIFLLLPTIAYTQIKFPLKKKSEQKANKEIDDALDKEIDALFGSENKKDNKDASVEDPEAGENNTAITDEKDQEEEVLKPWSKYDFVPGDIVIFEDNLESEQNGEFPSQWDLIDGYVENALFSNEKCNPFSNRE